MSDNSSASNMQRWLDLIRAPGWWLCHTLLVAEILEVIRINDATKKAKHAKTEFSQSIQYFKIFQAHPFLKLILHLMISEMSLSFR